MDKAILNPRNPLECIADLKIKGYDKDFTFGKKGLCTTDCDKEYTTDQITIDQEFRYEGMSNPGDMSVIYAISTHDDVKGHCLVSYAPKIHEPVHDFLRDVEMRQKKSSH